MQFGKREILVLGFFLAFSLFSVSTNAWWDSEWQYRMPINVNATDAQTMFPVNITIDTSSLISANKLNTNCSDLRFANSTDNELDWEFGSYDNATYGCNSAQTEIWVETNINDTIYGYYGNSGAAFGNDTTGTWDSNFSMVWHFKSDLTTIYDSTANAHDGTISQAVYTDGIFGNAMWFDGSDDYVTIEDSSVNGFSNGMIEFWAYFFDGGGTNNVFIAKQHDGVSTDVRIDWNDGNNIKWRLSDSDSFQETSVLKTNQWYYITIVWDGINHKTYINGTEDATAANTNGVPSRGASTAFQLGDQAGDLVGYTTPNMVIDEFRIHSYPRSAEWIMRSYEQHLNSIGSEETGGIRNYTETRLFLNGTEGNFSANFGEVINITATLNVTETFYIDRNGSQIGSGTSPININTNNFAAHIYNITAYWSGNSTHEPSSATYYLTVNKTTIASELNLSVTPSWTVQENTEVTITCSALSNFTYELHRDGVNISSPYTTVLPFGIYNFTCFLPIHENYTLIPNITTNWLNVLSGGFGCVDTNIYAFQASITSSYAFTFLNFTNLISNGYVKSDLSDVWVNTSLYSVEKNSSEGLIRVNSSSFTIRFGNYIGNQSYGEYSGTIENLTSFSYTEISPYYILTFLEEATGIQQLPPNSNRTLSLLCSGGTSSFNLSESKILIPTFEQLDDIRTMIEYSPTERYWRNLKARAPVEHKNMYLVDAEQKQVVELKISLIDFTARFKGALLKAEKYLEGSLQTITEMEFDLEDKVIVYLINGDKYQISVDNGVEVRNVGDLVVDTIDLSKTFIIGEFPSIDFEIGKLRYNITLDDGMVKFFLSDPANKTMNTSMWIWNYTNQSQLFYFTSSTNRSLVNFNYAVPDPNATYKVEVKIQHEFFGEESMGFIEILSGFPIALLFPLIAIPTFVTTGISIVAIISVPLIFGSRYGALAAIVTVIITGLFMYWGLYPLSISILALALFLAVLNKLREERE